MNQGMIGLVGLHRIARAYRNEQKHALVGLLDQRPPEGVVPLNAPGAFVGPVHHDLTPTELSERGIRCLTLENAPSQQKDGTDG